MCFLLWDTVKNSYVIKPDKWMKLNRSDRLRSDRKYNLLLNSIYFSKSTNNSSSVYTQQTMSDRKKSDQISFHFFIYCIL